MRILSRMVQGDYAWEVAGKNYFSQFNDSTQRPGRVLLRELLGLREQGWIRRITQQPEAHRLDYWDITEAGRAIVTLHETRIGPARHLRAGETDRRFA
jgi:DNA-binding HxlR family transcriptional regulator